MESIGGSYVQGYSLGQQNRQFEESRADSNRANALNSLASNSGGRKWQHLVAGGGSGGGGGKSTGSRVPSPSQIKEAAVDDYLSRRERELDVQAKQIRNEGMQYAQDKAKRDEMSAEVDKAQGRADQLRTENAAAGEKQQAEMATTAVQSLHLGDQNGFKQFFDQYGAPGVTVQGFKRGNDGSIEVHFEGEGEGKQVEKFKNADEVVRKLIMPAAAIAAGFSAEAKGKAGTGTGTITPNLESKLRQQAIDEGAQTEEEIQDYVNQRSPQGQQASQGGGMQMATGKEPEGYTRKSEYGGNMASGQIDQGVKHNYIEYKDENGNPVRKATMDGEVVELAKNPKTGNWYRKGETPPGEAQPQGMQLPEQGNKAPLNLDAYETPDEKETALRQNLQDNGVSDQDIEKYIQAAKAKGKL